VNDRFELRLAESWPPQQWRDVTVLAAVSGGPDSMALLRGLVALAGAGPGRLVAGHVNHQLRGAESDEDERFVRQQCEALGLSCEVGREPVGGRADEDGDGLEAAARRVRYEFLTETAHRVGARFVATGHTADDQAETILHRILRGTGIAGLAGSPRVRPLSPATTLIRPMLEFRRAEVIAYLERLGQPFREDRTNANPQFTRNRIRHELLPQLARQYNPNVVEALVRLGTLARESQSALEPAIEELMRSAVRDRGDDVVVIDRPRLESAHRHLVRELFVAIWRRRPWPEQGMRFDHWDRLAELAQSKTAGTIVLPGTILARAEGAEMTLARTFAT
jgi:tRNA(Ile)-lysidine synthase